jgi:hypothetical protein
MNTETLRLTLKKKWFDMIASGEKKEEYREIKPYWINRLQHWGNAFDECREYNFVEFRNGYRKDSPVVTLVCEGISISIGKEEWGAESGKEYYVIKLGAIVQ